MPEKEPTKKPQGRPKGSTKGSPKKPKPPTKTEVKKATRLASRNVGLLPFTPPQKPAFDLSKVDKKTAFIFEVFTRNPVGRPRLYDTAEALEAEIANYFTHCYENKVKLTITGLVLFCGFSDRKSFYEYEEKPEFTHIVKKARAVITMNYELMLQEAFPQGAVFALKNLGWTAEEQIEQTHKTNTTFYVGDDEDDDEFINYEDGDE